LTNMKTVMLLVLK